MIIFTNSFWIEADIIKEKKSHLMASFHVWYILTKTIVFISVLWGKKTILLDMRSRRSRENTTRSGRKRKTIFIIKMIVFTNSFWIEADIIKENKSHLMTSFHVRYILTKKWLILFLFFEAKKTIYLDMRSWRYRGNTTHSGRKRKNMIFRKKIILTNIFF
jgi:hypothetical protein